MSRSQRDERRIEYGDWQTPDALAHEVLGLLDDQHPTTVLEPTCGVGAFLAAAAERFPSALLKGFDISADYVSRANARLPRDRSAVAVADFFDISWERVFSETPGPVLVVGNPPWVTSAALGGIEAGNLPAKANFKRLAGFDAMTGKSNFDISEWMLIRLLEALAGRQFTLAMLCKASVARRLLEHAGRRGWALRGEVRAIDARQHFAAAVDAVLLCIRPAVPGGVHENLRWDVHDSLKSLVPRRVMGFVNGKLCSDVEAFAATASLEGSSPRHWRSGLKHDCSDVMELIREDGRLRNGLGQEVDVEDEAVFALLKGSDVANSRLVPRRSVIVTQQRLGEDTSSLRVRTPKLWRYLEEHRALLDGRKSSIYRDQPAFSIFGVGDYSFAPYKLAICGLYKRFAFTVVGPEDGRPVMLDDTVYFLPCASEEEAHLLREALSGPRAQAFFEARVFWDAKRPIGKALLQTLAIERLLPEGGVSGASSSRMPEQRSLPL